MIRSMTAFARREAQEEWGSATWELRSVNHRYLEVYTRLPEELRALEPEVRQRVAKRLRRGKVECNLRFQANLADASTLSINAELAEQLAKASREVDQLLYNSAPVQSMDILRWPGVLVASPLDTEVVHKSVLSVLDHALKDLDQTRAREGKKIQTLLKTRVDEMEPLVQEVRERMPQIVDAMRERLRTKLAELKAEVDEQRLEQEIAILALKVDVAEELDRLDTHIEETRRVLASDKPVGRRLDFLLQEFNREANTLASKSADTNTTRAAVNLKVIIEQMREQVQNIE